MFYRAQYPVRSTAQSALHFSSTGKPVHSDTNSASPGSILAMQQYAQRLLTHIYTTVTVCKFTYIASYSFIQLSELGRHGESENAQTSKR